MNSFPRVLITQANLLSIVIAVDVLRMRTSPPTRTQITPMFTTSSSTATCETEGGTPPNEAQCAAACNHGLGGANRYSATAMGSLHRGCFVDVATGFCFYNKVASASGRAPSGARSICVTSPAPPAPAPSPTVTPMYATSSSTATCESEGGTPPTEAECSAACNHGVGGAESYSSDSWPFKPGCFVVQTGPYDKACHYNQNASASESAPSWAHYICVAPPSPPSCRNRECGCPPYADSPSWCSKDAAAIFDDKWCQESSQNCGECDGMWCNGSPRR